MRIGNESMGIMRRYNREHDDIFGMIEQYVFPLSSFDCEAALSATLLGPFAWLEILSDFPDPLSTSCPEGR